MDRPTFTNRAALVLSAAALVTSVGFVGGPSLARAMGVNADTVDGLHAVKSTATTNQRKNKLVAAGKTGVFNANVIPNSAKFPAKVPTGITLRGAWSLDSQYAGQPGDYGSSIDFGAQLPSAPIAEVVPSGAPTVECPGSATKPAAKPGWLCMYVTGSNGLDLSTFGYSENSFGVHWHFDYDGVSATGADLYARGTYAVTAGSPPAKSAAKSAATANRDHK